MRSYVCTHHVLFTIFGKHNVHLWRLSSNYFRWTNTIRKEHLTAISFVNWHCWNLLIDLYKYKQNLQTDKNLREYIYLPTTGMRKVMFPITLFCHMTKQVVCFFFLCVLYVRMLCSVNKSKKVNTASLILQGGCTGRVQSDFWAFTSCTGHRR